MDGYIPISNGYLLFSALAHRLKSDADFLHGNAASDGQKGICLSALMPDYFWRSFNCSSDGGVLSFKRGDVFAFRISFIENDAFLLFSERMAGRQLTLGGASFIVQSVSKPGDNDISCGVNAEKLRKVQTRDGMTVKFISPAGFKSEGQQKILPDPKIFYQSLALRWRTFFGESIIEEIPVGVVVGDFSLRSSAVSLKGGLVFRGCMGYVRYEWKNLGEEIKQALTCLSYFAFFCGVGYKTTQGMGQVIVKN